MGCASQALWWLIHLAIIASTLHLTHSMVLHAATFSQAARIVLHAPRKVKIISGSFVLTVASYYWARRSDPGRAGGLVLKGNTGQGLGEKVVIKVEQLFDSEDPPDLEKQLEEGTCAFCGTGQQAPTTKHCLLVRHRLSTLCDAGVIPHKRYV